MNALTLDTVVVRGNRHIETEADSQVFMMRLDEGKYFALDASARRVWQLVAEPVSLGNVVTTLMGEYEVEFAQCQRDVLKFAETLLRSGLIVAEQT
jgi:hypothetical protein